MPRPAADFAGLWPAVITPLSADGRVALDVLEQMVERFVAQGLDGLYVTGSTGQWPLLTLDERRDIAACCVQTAAGRIPVMVHVGAMTTRDAVALAEHAARIGADAVSAVAPPYYAYSADVVFRYYEQLGGATNLPLYAYHLHTQGAMKLAPAEYVERLLQTPNIAGMKVTDLDLNLLGLIHTAAGDRLRLFSGADEVLCQAVMSGAIGAIGTFYNLWGSECRAARQAAAAGDLAGAAHFMSRFQLAISRCLRSGGMWSFLRRAMQLKHQVDIGMPRPPLGSLDRSWTDAEVHELLNLMTPPL
ncbi:MAG: dihydrodipicolinate synthase family protein [Pirellulales bacterium]